MSTITPIPVDPTTTPGVHPKVLNPAFVTLAVTILAALLAGTGTVPGVSDSGNGQWVVPLMTGIIGLVQFLVGYFSPNKPAA